MEELQKASRESLVKRKAEMKGENNGKNIEQGKRHPYHHLDIFCDDFKDQ